MCAASEMSLAFITVRLTRSEYFRTQTLCADLVKFR